MTPLDLPTILSRADAADIPALCDENARLRTALEQAIARGAAAVDEALREGEEARAELARARSVLRAIMVLVDDPVDYEEALMNAYSLAAYAAQEGA